MTSLDLTIPPLLLFEQGIFGDVMRRKDTATLRRILYVIFEDLLEGNFEARAVYSSKYFAQVATR